MLNCFVPAVFFNFSTFVVGQGTKTTSTFDCFRMLCFGSEYFKGSMILRFCGFNQFDVSKFSGNNFFYWVGLRFYNHVPSFLVIIYFIGLA